MLLAIQGSPALSYWLDQIADAYTPLLLLIALVDVFFRWRRGDRLHGLKLGFAIVVVYGLMFADHYFKLWPHLGLDYSTHTAAAVALVICIAMAKPLKMQTVLAGSLLLYAGLMMLLGYHTWADILSTAVIIVLVVLPLFLRQLRPEARS